MVKRKYVRKGASKSAPKYQTEAEKVKLSEISNYYSSTIETKTIQEDVVNHPKHYNAGKYETIDIIEDVISNYEISQDAFLVGQIIRYLSRAPLKGDYLENLEKAQWYLNRLVERNK